MKPPSELDGARVLWWSWSGREPYGEHGTEGEDRWVHGFAVCRYEENGSIYRFSCNKHWEVVNDADCDTEEQAKASIPMNYDETRVKWQAFIT